MDYRVDRLVGEELRELVLVPHVEDMEGHVLARELLETADDRGLGVAEVVDDDDVVPLGEQREDRVAADIAGAAGDEDPHGT